MNEEITCQLTQQIEMRNYLVSKRLDILKAAKLKKLMMRHDMQGITQTVMHNERLDGIKEK